MSEVPEPYSSLIKKGSNKALVLLTKATFLELKSVPSSTMSLLYQWSNVCIENHETILLETNSIQS